VFKGECDQKNISIYLRDHADSERDVSFQGVGSINTMMQLAIYCRHIKVLRVASMALTSPFRDLVWQNRNIQEIRLERVTSADTTVLQDLCFYQLKVLEVRKSTCQEGFIGNMIAECQCLTTMVMDGSAFSDMRLVLTSCPQLRLFSGGIVEEYMEEFTLCASHLVSVSFAAPSSVTDESVRHVVKNLTCLRSLNIRNCALLTDLSLQFIAEYAGNRLEVLHTDIKHPELFTTQEILEEFGRKSNQLHVLNVYCGDEYLCDGSGTSSLVCGLPQLHTLVVNRWSTIGASSRAFAAKIRPNLKILIHDDSTVYNLESMAI